MIIITRNLKARDFYGGEVQSSHRQFKYQHFLVGILLVRSGDRNLKFSVISKNVRIN